MTTRLRTLKETQYDLRRSCAADSSPPASNEKIQTCLSLASLVVGANIVTHQDLLRWAFGDRDVISDANADAFIKWLTVNGGSRLDEAANRVVQFTPAFQRSLDTLTDPVLKSFTFRENGFRELAEWFRAYQAEVES